MPAASNASSDANHAPPDDAASDDASSAALPTRLWTTVRRILRLAWPYRWRLGGAVLATALGSMVALVVPLGLRELLNAVFETANRALLDRLTIGLIVLFVLQALFSFLGRYGLEWTGERVVTDLRKRLYAHLHGQSLRFFANRRTGDLTSRLTNDVSSVRDAVTQALAESFTQVISLVGSVALMIILNWRLSLIIFVVVPVVTAAAIGFGRWIRRLARTLQDDLADTTAIAEESIAGIRTVKGFARSTHEITRYHEAVERLFGTAHRKVWASALFSAFVGFLFFGALVAIFWYGGTEVLAGRLTTGDLVAFIFYAFNIARSVGGLSRLYSTLNSAAGASERIFQLLDEPATDTDPSDMPALPSIDGQVAFDHVTFAYEPDTPVLHDLSFTIPAGQTVALVGPSGAGKTTLLSLIPRFYDPQSGVIRVDATDIRSATRQSLREQLALVSQDVHLFNDTIRANIRYGQLDASDAAIEDAARAANAHGFITNLPDGYDAAVGERGVKLSGGQRQRIAIARALLRDARILLLDEATSALDAESEAEVQEALTRLMESRTTFVIAHRLATVQDADRILVLDEGRLAQDGTHDTLRQQPGLYQRLADLQFREGSEASASASS